jgi:hypothetical protein
MLIPDLSLRPELVRIAGIEPARPKSADFKSAVSTYFTIPAYSLHTTYPIILRMQGRALVPRARLELAKPCF